jgi:hypothetical protein
MALKTLTRRQLSYALGSQDLAKNFDTAWTAGSGGTPDPEILRRLVLTMGNRKAATLFFAALDADSALNSFTQTRLAVAMGSQAGAGYVAAGLG